MDLDKIKRIACNLADEDVMETDYSPVIISHPYFNSGIMPNEKGEFVNILENEVEYDKAINRVKKAIMERKDAFSILAMVNKPYMLVFVYLIFNYLSDEDKGLLLRYALEIYSISWNQERKRL